MRVMFVSALVIGVAVLRASQQLPPRLSPEAEELQKLLGAVRIEPAGIS